VSWLAWSAADLSESIKHVQHGTAVFIGKIEQDAELFPKTAGFWSFGGKCSMAAGLSQEFVHADG